MDLGLGILLRHEEILDGKTLGVTELTEIRLDPDPVDDDRFVPPGGWDSVHRRRGPTAPRRPRPGGEQADQRAWPRAVSARWSSPRGPGPSSRPRGKSPRRRCRPIAEPLPADGPAATDEMLHLLDASRDRWAPGIAATLHQWHDIAALLAQVPDSARRAGFGGLGHLIDAAGERVATLHMVSRLSFDGSGRYRIEPALPAELAARSFRHRAETIICDGERQWTIVEDEVARQARRAAAR